MGRTINMIAQMIYTGRYRRNASESTNAAQQFKSTSATAAAASATAPSAESRLRALDRLRDQHMVSPEEYETKRAEILKQL